MAVTTQHDLIHETSTTTGTSSFTTIAVNGKVQFGDSTNGFGTGVTANVFDYYITNRDQPEWERGTGHCSALGTLVRDTVVASSNANALVSFSAGTKDITNDIPAAQQLRASNNLSEVASATTARSNVYAAPFDALAFNGIQINGSIEVDQEHAGAVVTGVANGTYIVDGFKVYKVGTMVVNAQQVADAPAGYTKSLKISVTTAEGAIAATDLLVISHLIEGSRIARLGFGAASAQSLTVGFWVKAHRTGTYSGSIVNGGNTRAYPFSFTVNVADTWEFKAVTIAGDVTGTWPTDATLGMSLMICMACGSSNVGTANTWAASILYGVTGTTNGVAAITDTFQITGVIMLPGVELPTSARAPFIMRSADIEFSICRRHYWRINYAGNQLITTLQALSATNANGALLSFNTMRAAPTIGFSAVANFSAQQAGGGGVAASSLPVTSTVDTSFFSGAGAVFASGLVAGNATNFFSNTTAWIAGDARL